MRARIVFTRPDGGVCVVAPSANFIRACRAGGRWGAVPRGWAEAQVERRIGDGTDPDVARRYVQALMAGGATTADALGLIRDTAMSGPHNLSRWGFAPELIMADQQPGRWFRDAWRRGRDGGPIRVDLDAARRIQADRIARKRRSEMERLAQEADAALLGGRLGNMLPFLREAWAALPLAGIGDRLAAAGSEDELRGIIDLELLDREPERILEWRLSA